MIQPEATASAVAGGFHLSFSVIATGFGDFRRYVWLSGIHGIAVVVTVVVANPGHGESQVIFITAFGREVQKVIGADKDVEAPRIRRIGMEYLAFLVFREKYSDRSFADGELAFGVVIGRVAFLQVVL